MLIKADKSVIVAADVPDFEALAKLALAVKGVPGISGVKLGIINGLDGLPRAVEIIRENLGDDAAIIFDMQKAGNDIPAMGAKFAKKVADAGVDAAILFPFTGPATQEAWTKALQDEGLTVLTGGIMTHSQFLVSEGGYISDKAPEAIFRLACELGVKDFVVPGNKLDWIKRLRALLEEILESDLFALYAPGFITQGGDLSEAGEAAGKVLHGIIGSGIYGADDPRQAASNATSQLVA